MHLESNNNNIITIVSFFDDNYGDMLIKNSFECILKTVLDNLGQKGADFRRMPLREVDEELIKSSSLVCFSGGGLFGLSYLTFYPYVEKILEIAEDSNVPVVFSSMGINNMDYREGDDDKFIKMLGHKSIKAISVREQIDWFRKYNKREDLSVAEVCDPAMWSRYMIKPLNEPKQQNDKKLVGINVVRGGLFADNGRTWDRSKFFEYVDALISIADKNGYDYFLYTNGSIGDNKALKAYVENNNLDETHYSYVNSTEELLNIINRCDFICAVRLHSAIIAASFEKPVINLVWNDKIPFFYRAINKENMIFEEDAISIPEIEKIINEKIGKQDSVDRSYQESLYQWLFGVMKGIYSVAEESEPYDFEEVANKVYEFYQDSRLIYKLEDYSVKTQKLTYNYYKMQSLAVETKKELKHTIKENEKLQRKNEKLNNENDKLKARLNKILNHPVIKTGRKIKSIFK